MEKDKQNDLLDELYSLSIIEYDRELTDQEHYRYLELVHSLGDMKVLIMFGMDA